MEEERIALEFLTVYKKYKDRSYRKKKTRVQKEGMQLERENSGKKSRLNKISK
ncbi:MAG TPA: hypothetical protein VK155_04480 [Bacteroidales bacterium]|jgi:hypothetical protein|nr:hypothetical protein [Bacteroidales bacterium]